MIIKLMTSVCFILLLTNISVLIRDPEGDNFNWSINTSPNIGSSYGFNETNGTKYCNVSGLNYSTVYHWYVYAYDGHSSMNRSYWFRTENIPWDINNDSRCNIIDLLLISTHYGEIGLDGWITEDVDNNGKVQLNDLLITSNHYRV